MKAFASMLVDLFAPILSAARPLFIVVAGLYLAFGVGAPTLQRTGMTALIAVVLAGVLFWIGSIVIRNHPRAGLFFMELWVLGLVAVAVFASALTAKISVALSAPEGASEQTKVLLSTMTTAACAFMSSAFIAGGTADGQSRIASRIRAMFQNRFMSAATAKSKGKDTADASIRIYLNPSIEQRAVQAESLDGGVSGWGLEARWSRARVLAEWIDKGAPPGDPPAEKTNVAKTGEHPEAPKPVADSPKPAAPPGPVK